MGKIIGVDRRGLNEVEATHVEEEEDDKKAKMGGGAEGAVDEESEYRIVPNSSPGASFHVLSYHMLYFSLCHI